MTPDARRRAISSVAPSRMRASLPRWSAASVRQHLRAHHWPPHHQCAVDSWAKSRSHIRTIVLPEVDHPVMQPMFVTLPEFDAFRRDSESTPMCWPWNVLTGKACFEFLYSCLQRGTRSDRATLLTCTRIDAVLARTTVPIRVAFGFGGVCYRSLNAYLPIKLIPMKVDACAWVCA